MSEGLKLFLRRLSALDGMQFLARLKPNGLARSDADFGAGAGIATDTSLAGANAENAKSAQFNALSCRQSLLETLKDGIHRSFCPGAGQARALDHMMDDVLLNQWSNLAGPLQ